MEDEADPIEAAPAPEAAPMEDEADPIEAAPMQDASAPRTHVVVAGDNLWELAEQYLGNGERFMEIAEANPSLRNPNRLHIGDELTIPAN